MTERESGGREIEEGMGVNEGKARGEDGGSDEQNKVGRGERWEYWRRDERDCVYEPSAL